ncbi:isocitrate/isopropylmalate dehydrogenase family protein [Pandoraea cepalis]|uniref:3-isopropylmalate dehydrogenase n=1 Tax=Pandoraea cepalis TaxID=2508294 RepID=A0A5E4VNH5_9BURK|nr:isocitrate/isopropylmalate dehydrogenase family protein [Pandoraea cepalis]VVE12864.1 tartrate dehydrogenase [Pandoraea cepalis]
MLKRTTQLLDVAVLPGDGIGQEVMPACLEVLEAVQKVCGISMLHCTTYNAGAQYYAKSGVALPDETLRACKKSNAILFGAMGWPDIRHKDGTEIIPQLDLRMELGLYAGVRPIRWFPGLPRVLTDERAKQIDFVLVREQTEGLFYARGRGRVENDQEAYDTMQITRSGSTRVSDFAFRLAEQRKAQGKSSRVTCVDKANVFASMAFFRKVFDEVASRYPDIEKDHAYVDAMALTMVKKPWTLDVMVTENMFGDILSDLAAGLIGGMGMASSADIGDDHGLFQPAHGTAPDIAGQGKANPCAMLLSAAMMLEWLAFRHDEPQLATCGAVIEKAVEHALASGGVVPMEYGGSAGAAEVTKAVIDALPIALRAVTK